MRILSDFHDYYDGLMALDEDRELIYQRKIKEIRYKTGRYGEKGEYPFPLCAGVTSGYWRHPVHVEQYLVGFCGVIYPFLAVSLRNAAYGEKPTECRSIEDLDLFVESNFSDDEAKAYKSKKYDRLWSGFKRSEYKKFFEECEAQKSAFGHVFEEHRCPIFVSQADANRAVLVVNAPLSELDFAKVMPPYQAYQEIRMFMGNMAQPEKPIPAIDDETMAEIKGHGGKYSFRKPPQK